MASGGSKFSVFSEWFTGDHVLLHLDSRRSGVTVPAHLAGNHSLTLKVSRLFQGRTDYDEERIIAFLKFGGDYAALERFLRSRTEKDLENYRAAITRFVNESPRKSIYSFIDEVAGNYS